MSGQKREVCSFGISGVWAWQVRGPSRRRGGSIPCDAAPAVLSKWEFSLLPHAVVTQHYFFLFSRGMCRHPAPRPCPDHCPLPPSSSWELRCSLSWDDLRAGMLSKLGYPLSWDALRARMLSKLGCSQHGGHCLGA